MMAIQLMMSAKDPLDAWRGRLSVCCLALLALEACQAIVGIRKAGKGDKIHFDKHSDHVRLSMPPLFGEGAGAREAMGRVVQSLA